MMSARPSSSLPQLFLLLTLFSCGPNSSFADSPPTPLLSYLVPWTADGVVPGDASGAIESLGRATYFSSPTNERRLQALLESDRLRGVRGAAAGPDGVLDEWESPKSPDLFLLTEVGEDQEDGRRRRGSAATEVDAQNTQSHRTHEQEVARLKRQNSGGGFVGGSGRIRTGGSGGGFAGSAGMMRVGGSGGNLFGSGGRGLASNGRMNEGPSLSIVNPLDVLRQRLLLEIARRRMRESEDQIQANRELLKSIGKREAPGGGGGNDGAPTPRTPSSM